MWLGFVQIFTNRASRALGELEQALSLNRKLGAAHAWKGQAKITMGRAEEAEAHVDQAFRLSPNDAVGFMWTHIRGLAKLHLGADEEAVALFRRSVDASRNYPLSHFYMAAALANSAASMRRKPKLKLGGRSRHTTRSPDFSAWRRATTRPTSSSASTFWRGCGKPAFRKTDGRAPQRRRAGLSTGDRLSWRKLCNEGDSGRKAASSGRLPDAASCVKASAWRGGDPHFVFLRLASSGRRWRFSRSSSSSLVSIPWSGRSRRSCLRAWSRARATSAFMRR